MKHVFNRMNNVKVKAQYVLDNTEKVRSRIKISSGNLMLINLAKRDGLKCDCCGTDDLYFKLHPKHGLFLVSSKMYHKKPLMMTMDHNILKSLDGNDTIYNQHLLCERCNATRGNLFAEYSEFKDWFNTEKSYGRDPYSSARNLVQNFCYIEFNKNISSVKDLEHFAKGSVFPPFLRKHLIELYMKYGNFKREVNASNNAYNYTNKLLLTRYNTDAWNELMNSLVVMIIQKKHKYKIENPKIDFSIYKMYNKNKMSSEDFLNIIHNKIQSTVFNLGNVADKERMAKLRKENIALIQKQAETIKPIEEVQKIVEEHHNEVVPRFTWWQKIVNAFKVLIA